MPRKVEVDLVGKDHLSRTFKDAHDSGGKLHGFLSGTFKAGLVGVGAGFAAVGVAAKLGFDEFNEGQRVAAQTDAVLKSTGGSAHITAKQVDELAGALMRKSGVDDEAIKSGENMLLTFTNIRNETGKGNDVFNQTTKTLLDMSTATGQDMTKSAVQLGKALNDPIKGVSALSRVGVTFTEQQKDQIKAMVESGHTMDAQKLILGELSKEFGGSAEAAGKTFGGQINVAKQTLSNLAGEMVGATVPALTKVLTKVTENIPKLEEFAGKIIDRVQPVLTTVAGVISDHVVPIVQSMREIWVSAVTKIAAVLSDHGPELERIFRRIASAISFLANDVVIPILRPVLTVILPNAIGITISALDKFSGAISDVIGAVRNVANFTREKVGDIIGFWRDMPGQVAGVITGLGHKITDALHAVFSHLPGFVKDVLGISSPSRVFAGIGENIIDGAVQGIRSKGGALVDAAMDAFHAIEHAVPIGGVGPGDFVPSANAQIGAGLASRRFGWAGAQYDALWKLWQRESGWSQFADTRVSGLDPPNAAVFAYGIPQARPWSKYPRDGWPSDKGGRSNPEVQINWGLDYIKGRYGDPIRAWAHEQAFGWYGDGGIFDRPTIIGVGERGPEAVIPLDRAGGIGGDLHVHVHAGNVFGGEQAVEELALQIRNTMLRIGNRYGGHGRIVTGLFGAMA